MYASYFGGQKSKKLKTIMSTLINKSQKVYFKEQYNFCWMIFTLNLGTNLVNSWCQLLSVEAGEIIKKGPQMFSLWNRKTGLANCRKTEDI